MVPIIIFWVRQSGRDGQKVNQRDWSLPFSCITSVHLSRGIFEATKENNKAEGKRFPELQKDKVVTTSWTSLEYCAILQGR